MSFLSRLVPVAVALPLLLVSACGAGESTAGTTSTSEAVSAIAPPGAAGAKINTSPEQNRVRADKVETIAAEVPEAIRADGEFTVGFSGDGAPPLAFLADDDTTPIGVETDLAHLIADVLGLKVKAEVTSWENLFLATKSGKYDAVLNNVTVTEERKDIYDFATYRVDQLAWQDEFAPERAGANSSSRTVRPSPGARSAVRLRDRCALPDRRLHRSENLSDSLSLFLLHRPVPTVARWSYLVSTGVLRLLRGELPGDVYPRGSSDPLLNPNSRANSSQTITQRLSKWRDPTRPQRNTEEIGGKLNI